MSESPGELQRLLIVDDSRVIRVTARKILQNHFRTVEAVDGNNAWEILESGEPFALVVSDLTMPGMDGFGLLEKIRHSQQPHIRDLPVIIITGANESESTKQRATAAGATDFIGKPFDAVHLLASTQAHANAYQNRQSISGENFSLEDQIRTDPVTGLANEAALMERGYQLLSYAIRHRTGFAVAQLEINGYDRIFREHGAGITGVVVKAVAAVLKSTVRGEDMVARTGPARFALLLPGMDRNRIRMLTSRLGDDISQLHIDTGNGEIRCTVSIGVAAPEITAESSFMRILKTAREDLQQTLDSTGSGPATGTDVPGTGHIRPDAQEHIAGQPPLRPDDTGISLSGIEVTESTGVHAAHGRDDTASGREAAPAPSVLAATAVSPRPEVHAVPDAQAEEESIVITAPFSMFEDEHDESAPGVEGPAGSAEESTPVSPAPAGTGTRYPASADKLLAENRIESVSTDGQEAEHKRGLFSRLFGLFTRRRRHEEED